MSTSNNLTANDNSRGNANSNATTPSVVAGGSGWFGKEWTPRDVGIEQSETGHWRINWSEPNSLTADARARQASHILPPETPFDEVKRAREEEMREAKRKWALVKAARRQRAAERNRQRWQAKSRANPWSKVETNIWERGNRRKVTWCELDPETGHSVPGSEHFSLDTPLETLRALRDEKQRAGEPVRAARRDARKRKTEEQRPLKEERARARRKRVRRNIRQNTKGWWVHRSEPDPVTGRSRRHWVRPPADHQTLESVERFRDECERKDEEVRARIREAKHRQAAANAHETSTRKERNISEVWQGDRLRGFRVSVDYHDPETGRRRTPSRRFAPNTPLEELRRCRDDFKKRARGNKAKRFSVELRRLLKKAGLSNARAAQVFGIGETSIKRHLNNVEPSAKHLAIYKKVFKKRWGWSVFKGFRGT